MIRICSFSIIHVILLGFLLTLTNSCGTEVDPKLLPVLSTTEINRYTEATAQSGGNITSDAGSDVTSRGVCWATSPNPTIKDTKTSDAAGTGVFTSKLIGLIPSTTYYVRAYATTKKGTAYGVQVIFTTKSLALTTSEVTSITVNNAICGGIIATNGDSINVTVRGICWNTQSNPTITNSKTTDGKGTGKFTSTMTSLSVNTTYFVRAYVTNSGGTIYGNEVSFTTQTGAISLTTTAASSIKATSVTIGGTVPSDSGSPVTERGLCISKLPTPTITNKMVNGSGTGSFATNISGLTANTTYYVRAFATNSIGTAYGNEVSFTTLNGVINLTTTAVSNIYSNSATTGGNITSDGGATVTTRGVCWSTNTNPTTALSTKTSDATGTGGFSSSITGLTVNTTYYLRAYATNSEGTVYGSEVSFSTNLPTVTTTNISTISSTTATSGGNVTAIGGAAVNSKGVCWSTTSNPTISNSKTSDGTGDGAFSSSITGLKEGTTYFVRAFATNSVGTAYGTNISFRSTAVEPKVSTTAISDITGSSTTTGGNVISDGGESISAKGVCWSLSPNPTISNQTTIDGIGIGAFNSKINGLNPVTTYYIRAYATNNIGTAYGSEVSIKTLNTNEVIDRDGNIYHTVTIGNQVWLIENLKTTKYNDGTSIPLVISAVSWSGESTSAAYCWLNNDIPTNKDTYGALYNWNAVKTNKLAPAGWHVPTADDWTVLINFIGGSSSGGSLKETGTVHWKSPNTGATNSSGFTAMPGNSRIGNGDFGSGGSALLWSSTSTGSTSASYICLYYNVSYLTVGDGHYLNGMSVRCIKD